MIVYRLEDEKGRGPFTYSTRWPDDYKSDKALHAHNGCTILDLRDGRIDKSKYRFGCRNITQLKKYWGDIDKFTRDGWVIAKYKVRKNYVLFGVGDIEVAFPIDKAEKVSV